MEQFIQYLLLGLLIGSIYALVALGLVLIFRASGVLNFAQGQFVLLGAVIIWALVEQVGLPLWLSLIFGIIGVALLGWLLERLTIHPLIGQPVFSIIGMTLGLSIVLDAVYFLIWGGFGQGYYVSYIPTGLYHLGNIELPQFQVWSLVIILAIFGGLLYYLRRGRMGLAMSAIADDTQCARSLGVRATTILGLVWILAFVIAAIGGYFLGNMIGITCSMPIFGLKTIAVMILGGLESVGGVLIAGPLVGVLEYMCAGYIDPIVGGGFKDIFPFIILLIVLLVRPAGLFGWKRIERI